MTKSDLIDKIAEKYGISKEEAELGVIFKPEAAFFCFEETIKGLMFLKSKLARLYSINYSCGGLPQTDFKLEVNHERHRLFVSNVRSICWYFVSACINLGIQKFSKGQILYKPISLSIPH
jgi:hypothetical protein